MQGSVSSVIYQNQKLNSQNYVLHVLVLVLKVNLPVAANKLYQGKLFKNWVPFNTVKLKSRKHCSVTLHLSTT